MSVLRAGTVSAILEHAPHLPALAHRAAVNLRHAGGNPCMSCEGRQSSARATRGRAGAVPLCKAGKLHCERVRCDDRSQRGRARVVERSRDRIHLVSLRARRSQIGVPHVANSKLQRTVRPRCALIKLSSDRRTTSTANLRHAARWDVALLERHTTTEQRARRRHRIPVVQRERGQQHIA